MPTIFPAIYSTLSPSALAVFLSENYNLGDTQCALITRGVGDTYSVEAPGHRSILRVYRSSHRNYAQVDAEVSLLSALRTAGVRVSYPIADRSGRLIQELPAAEGVRMAVLFTYAPGKPVTAPNDAQLRDLGRQMARFHEVSAAKAAADLTGSADGREPGHAADSRWTFDTETTLFKPLEQLKPYLEDEDHAWLQKAAREIDARLSRMDTGEWSTGYCHYDFLPKNFHFDEDRVTLFDFDFMGRGWLVNDLMTFWQHYELDVYLGRTSRAEADRAYHVFLEAYAERRPLRPDEVEAVPLLGLGFWLFYMSFHTTHDQFLAFVQPSVLPPKLRFMRQLVETRAGIRFTYSE